MSHALAFTKIKVDTNRLTIKRRRSEDRTFVRIELVLEFSSGIGLQTTYKAAFLAFLAYAATRKLDYA